MSRSLLLSLLLALALCRAAGEGPIGVGPVGVGVGPVAVGVAPVGVGPVGIGPVGVGPVKVGPVGVGPIGIGGPPGGCEYPEGLQTYPDPGSCDRYFRCANGTLTQEVCGNGLLYSGGGAVHEGCDYHWRVNCDGRSYQDPVPAPGPCPYAFGLFPSGDGCVDYFVKCAYGIPQPELCPEGLAYDERTHACNWPDLVPQCSIGDAETLSGYSCPEQIPAGSASLRFGAFPRFATGRCDRLVTCVNYYPRITKCEYDKAVDEASLTCVDANLVPGCQQALIPGPPPPAVVAAKVVAPIPRPIPGPAPVLRPVPGPLPGPVSVPLPGPLRQVSTAGGRIVAIEGPGLALPNFGPGKIIKK